MLDICEFYQFDAEVKTSNVMSLIDVYEEEILDSYKSIQRYEYPEGKFLSYNKNNDYKWNAGSELLTQLKNNDTVKVTVRIYNPEKSFRLPDFLKEYFTFPTTKVLGDIESEKPKSLTILKVEDGVLGRELISLEDYNRYILRHRNPFEIDYFEKEETEDATLYKVWCNLPFSEYKNADQNTVGVNVVDGKLYCGEEEFDYKSKVEEYINGIPNTITLDVGYNCCVVGAIDSPVDLFIAKLIEAPVIPACLVFSVMKNGDKPLIKGEFSKYIMDIMQPHLFPNVVFIDKSEKEIEEVSNLQGDLFESSFGVVDSVESV